MKLKLSVLTSSVLAACLLMQTPVMAKVPFFGADDSNTSSTMPSLAPMLEQVTPAVVNINVAGNREVRQRVQDPFAQFYGQRELRRNQPFQGLGSGVIIDADKGYVVTNAHVIAEASEIQVTLKDGRTFEAKKIGEDPDSDIALLQIKATDLVAIKIADSDALRVGDYTVAIGNPFGLGQTVTSGIVSALGRSGLDIEKYEDFIQTDAAINSGNSGGALVNLRGELIGINTAILGPNGGNIGIGFAIPSNMMKNLVEQLIETGTVKRGLIGVSGRDVTPDLKKAMKLSVAQGVFIEEVTENSAAAKAGIQSGDVITGLNGKPIKSMFELRARVGTLGVGKKIRLDVMRDDKTRSFELTIGDASEGTVTADSLHPMLQGLELSVGQTIDGTKGIVINAIADNAPAQRLRLRQGDVIIGANRVKTDSIKQLKEVIEQSQGVIALQIQREDILFYVMIR